LEGEGRFVKSAVFAAFVWAGLASAQEPPVDQPVAVYDAAYFAEYRPITLLDMLDRIPGVSLAFRQAEERRGLRTNTDRILINGKQISAKDNSAANVLRRISATQVERIEVIRGAVAEIEMTSGRVVNIVLKTDGRGVWSHFVGGSQYRDGTVRPAGNVNYAYDSVFMNASVALSSDLAYRPWRRSEISRSIAGAPLADNIDTEQALNQYYRLSGTFDFRLDGDRELQVSALAQHRDIDRERRLELRGLTGAAPVETGETLEYDIRNRNTGEFGVDYSFPVGAAGTFTAVALFNIEAEDKDREVSNLRLASRPLTVTEDREDLKTESILRGTYDWPLAERQALKAGVEAVVNTQDTELNLFSIVGGVPVRVPIFNSDSKITEYRAEVFADHRWEPSEHWEIATGLTVELSDLNQKGSDVDSSRSLNFVKPTVEAFYKPTTADRTWVSVRRDVTQLDFLEFISTIQADDRELEAGNPRLSPEKSWDFETGWEHRLPNAGGFLSARGYYRDVDDVRGKVSFNATVSQPGNIGRGREFGGELEASLRLNSLSLWDGTLTSTYLRRDTRVTDPFSGRKRRFAGKAPYEFSVNYKHEIKPVDTQLTFIVSKQGKVFDYDLDDTEKAGDTLNFSLFADTTWRKELSFHAEVGNILNRKSKRERSVYVVNAIDGRVSRFDSRTATWGRYYLFAVKGQF
jgi:outer membrane receptor protein involved in Fe transport